MRRPGLPPAAGWELAGFEQRLDAWIDQVDPPDDIRLLVTMAVLSRYEDPYRGVSRYPDTHPDLWFGPIPGTRHPDGDGRTRVVAWSYFIVEKRRIVVADRIASLGLR